MKATLVSGYLNHTSEKRQNLTSAGLTLLQKQTMVTINTYVT